MYKTFLKKSLFILFPFIMHGQGYYNRENFGNRSVLLSGVVTGSVEDLGLTYYNPARIALVENTTFTINAKAYEFGTLKLNNVFGRNEKLDDSNFNEIPSFVAGTFTIDKWKNHHFAYALITKIRSNKNINFLKNISPEELEDDFKEAEGLTAEYSSNTKETDEWFGITWGTKIKDNLSIGVSAFASVYNFKDRFDLDYASLDQSENVILSSNEIKMQQTSYGMFWKVGLAWKLEKIDLGLNIDLPYLEAYNKGNFRFQKYYSGTENDEFRFIEFKNIKSQRKEPLGISVGAGMPIGKFMIHTKIDWHGKLSEYDRLIIPRVDTISSGFLFREKRKAVVNVGIGGEYYINEKWNLYGSASTDFSPLESNANIYDLIEDEDNKDVNFDSNFYHFGLGFKLNMKKLKLIMGSTFTRGTDKFDQPFDFPESGIDFPINDDPSSITVNRWQFVVGLEMPVFGDDVEIK